MSQRNSRRRLAKGSNRKCRLTLRQRRASGHNQSGWKLRPSLRFEALEERRLLSVAPLPQITVGRQVSAWSVADLQQNQVKIDYTVYNDQSNDLTGVLLTTTGSKLGGHMTALTVEGRETSSRTGLSNRAK